MPKFEVKLSGQQTFTRTFSATVEVEAADEDAARTMALADERIGWTEEFSSDVSPSGEIVVSVEEVSLFEDV